LFPVSVVYISLPHHDQRRHARASEKSRLARLDVTCACDGCALHFGSNGLSRGGASADTIFCLSRVRNQALLASCKVQAFSLHVNVNTILQQITTRPPPLQPTQTAQQIILNLEGEQSEVFCKVYSYHALVASRTHVLFVASRFSPALAVAATWHCDILFGHIASSVMHIVCFEVHTIHAFGTFVLDISVCMV
jgi:hypothetical protein